jgi:hypothetical protein
MRLLYPSLRREPPGGPPAFHPYQGPHYPPIHTPGSHQKLPDDPRAPRASTMGRQSSMTYPGGGRWTAAGRFASRKKLSGRVASSGSPRCPLLPGMGPEVLRAAWNLRHRRRVVILGQGGGTAGDGRAPDAKPRSARREGSPGLRAHLTGRGLRGRRRTAPVGGRGELLRGDTQYVGGSAKAGLRRTLHSGHSQTLASAILRCRPAAEADARAVRRAVRAAPARDAHVRLWRVLDRPLRAWRRHA